MCSRNANRTNHLVVNKERFVVEGGPRARRLQDDKSSRKEKAKKSVIGLYENHFACRKVLCSTRPLWSDVFSCSLSEMAPIELYAR